MKEKIGFMGLGIMGQAMAVNIMRAGYPLAVYNRSREKAEVLAGKGAVIAPDPKTLASRADVIIAMVTGPEALDALLWGPDGAGQAMEAGTTFINMSTVPPRFTRQMHRKLTECGVHFVDAPVSGSRKPAEDAALVILAGGDRADVERCMPLLQTMGKKVIYCGAAGQGSMLKMTVNLLLGLMMESFAEAVKFGRTGGLAMDTIWELIGGGALSCGLYQVKQNMFRENRYPVNFPLKHITKDLKFVVDTAYETGAPVPAGHTALHLFRLGAGEGRWGDLDMAAVMKVLDYLGDHREQSDEEQ